MDKLNEFLLSRALWESLAVAVLSFGLWLLIKRFMKKQILAKSDNEKTKRNTRTAGRIAKGVILLFAVLTILQINGINVTSLLTGLGVAGVVVGFALQDILKDVIMGANIVLDRYYAVGDYIRYHDAVCRVESMNLKATKLYDLEAGSHITVSNRNISEAVRVSDRFSVYVPGSYEVPAETMRTVCGEICRKLTECDGITEADFLGTERFEASQILYRISVLGDPEKRFENRRKANGMIQDILAENHLEIPFDRLDVHLEQ